MSLPGWLKRLFGSSPCAPGAHRGKLEAVFVEDPHDGDPLGPVVSLGWQCERCDTVFLVRPEGM